MKKTLIGLELLRRLQKRTREYKARLVLNLKRLRLKQKVREVAEINNKWAKGYGNVLESEMKSYRSQ